mgnify:CR=1 FL=1
MEIINKYDKCFVCAIDFRDPMKTVTVVYEGTIEGDIQLDTGHHKKIKISTGADESAKYAYFPVVKENVIRGNVVSAGQLMGTIFGIINKNPRQYAICVKTEAEVDEAMDLLRNEFFKEKALSFGLSMKELAEKEEEYKIIPQEIKEEYMKLKSEIDKGNTEAETDFKNIQKKINKLMKRRNCK